MAPKKKGGRKKEEIPNEAKAEDDAVPEHSREFYLIQIRDLERRLARYQKKWDELQVSEDLFRSEYNKMIEDNKEIVAFLKKTLTQRVDEIAELTVQLQNLQVAKDTDKDAFESQLVQLRHEFQETKDQLTSENMLLSGKLASLEEFRIQKDNIMAQFAALEDQLKQQEVAHKEFIYNLERKAVLDKDRLKKEMVQRVNVVAAEFRKVSNSQMAETTKRTIRENATLSLQLGKITEKSLQLIQENDRLKMTLMETQKKLELLEQNEKKLAKNNRSNLQIIGMLTSKSKELQASVDEYVQKQKAMAQLQEANQALEKQNLLFREEVNTLKDDLEQRDTDSQSQAKIFLKEQQRRINAEKVLKRAAQGLETVLAECPTAQEEDGYFDVMFHLRRNDMLQSIMTLVNRGLAHIETQQQQQQQQLHPFFVESQREESSSPDICISPNFHLRASHIQSHCVISNLPKHRLAHSLPSMSMLSREGGCLDAIRSYCSAKEPLMTVWKTEKAKDEDKHEDEVVEEQGLPKMVVQRTTQELLGK